MYGAGAWTVVEEGVQAGLIAYGQDGVATKWSFDGSFDDGVGILGLYRFFWNLDDKPGSLLVAGGGSTKDYASLDPNDWTILPGEGLVDGDDGKPWSASVYLYQEFWHGAGDDGRKAWIYMAGGMADQDPSFVRWNISGTVEAMGLLPSRPADRMGIASWYLRINDDVQDLLGDVGVRLRDGSWGVEVYYNAAITPWLHLTGDFQIAQNEQKSDGVAVIPGVRLVLDF
jgi:porin